MSCTETPSSGTAPRRSAQSAASLSTLASSAPLSPGRSRASWSRSMSAASLIFFECTRRMSARPCVVGLRT
eukprot:6802452-Pyramimonas_sp.AAC.1